MFSSSVGTLPLYTVMSTPGGVDGIILSLLLLLVLAPYIQCMGLFRGFRIQLPPKMNLLLLQQSLNAQNTPKIQVFPEIPPPKTFFCYASGTVVLLLTSLLLFTCMSLLLLLLLNSAEFQQLLHSLD